jgi:hypothetical protein
MAASAMDHQHYALHGGTFPLPTPAQSGVNNNTIGGATSIFCLICIVEKTSQPILTNWTFATAATKTEI